MKTFLLLAALVVATSATPSLPRTSGHKLGLFRPNPRITNGENAQEGQFPYQVSYQWGIFGFNQHVCGGSIISPTWILTAGHCVTEIPAIGDHLVVAGITNLNSNIGRQEISVVESVVHDGYRGDVGPNDIALLRLSSPLQFNDVVQPIALPRAGAVATGDAVLSGWGATWNIIIPIMPEILQTVTIPVLSYQECNDAIERLLSPTDENPLSEVSNVCTGPLTGGISACSGDSGGPLAQDGTLIGVVSWGFTPCGSDGAPSVYTRVSSFLDFIGERVNDLPQ